MLGAILVSKEIACLGIKPLSSCTVKIWGGGIMTPSSEYLDLAGPEAAGSDSNTNNPF